MNGSELNYYTITSSLQYLDQPDVLTIYFIWFMIIIKTRFFRLEQKLFPCVCVCVCEFVAGKIIMILVHKLKLKGKGHQQEQEKTTLHITLRNTKK